MRTAPIIQIFSVPEDIEPGMKFMVGRHVAPEKGSSKYIYVEMPRILLPMLKMMNAKIIVFRLAVHMQELVVFHFVDDMYVIRKITAVIRCNKETHG